MITRPIRCDPSRLDDLLTREWLVTNGLGGYASGTISGVATRRYHGLLISALPAPLGRMMMLNHLSELVRLPDGSRVRFGGWERASGALESNAEHLIEFRLEDGLPVWTYDVGSAVIEKRILLPHLQNTAHVTYRVVSGGGKLRLKLRPALNFRGHDDHVSEPLKRPYKTSAIDDRIEIEDSLTSVPLRLKILSENSAFTSEPMVAGELLYRIEESRGYSARGELYAPGYFRADLDEDHDVTFIASTESWDSITALSPRAAFEAEKARRQRLLAASHPASRQGPAAELVFAADQFIIAPAGRKEDEARARAEGGEARTIIAGYHWFTDWGRDTMISLDGLALITGRTLEAGYILKTFAQHVRDGLIPNMFPEGEKEGLYHTADATLWFFHALDKYLAATQDRNLLRQLMPKLDEIITHHLSGTRFGIGVDPRDGLLRQGQIGYQLTWMDAKMGDWVVTPRRGKAVEINALWYNALKLYASWVREERGPDEAGAFEAHAARAKRSFNQRFWYAAGDHLYDVIDTGNGDDPALRPNQLLAISLKNPVLDREKWASIFASTQKHLATPVGLRSLAPDHPDYKPNYFGDLKSRDGAYHQGTVWGWLIGPYVDAWRKTHPEQRAERRNYLEGCLAHLDEACIGSISEIFDASEPFTPRGCVAQAWSVAEVLRCLVEES